MKAYPWCFGDFDPVDSTCWKCSYRNVCRRQTDLVKTVEQLRLLLRKNVRLVKLPFHLVEE